MKNQIKICMIGAGRVGKNHSKTIVANVPEATIVALVDPMISERQNLADEFDIKYQFDDFEQALDKADFDAVIITTPPATHLPLSIMAAESKKHIFLEKPMGLTIEECDEIIKAVNNKKVLLQMGFMRRFDPDFQNAFMRIQDGEIGEPMMIKSNTHGPGLPKAKWAIDIKTSNGMLSEVNSHDWDSTRWLVGSNFNRVYAEIANFKGPSFSIDTPNFYDNVLVNIKFDSGALGSISGICPCGYGYDARVEIIGTKGIMKIGSLEGQDVIVCTDRETGLIHPITKTWPQRFASGYINELKHFIECIQKEKYPDVTPEDGKWSVAGVLAGTKSFLEERPVYINEILGKG